MEEQRGVIRFLTAEGVKPADIHRRMVAVYGGDSVTHKSIESKWPGLLTEGVILLHDNARPHVSRVTQSVLAKFKWEQFEHPPYSPDMSPCDFHLFGPLKKHLKGKRFHSDDELKDTVEDWLLSQPQDFWEQGIFRLVKQWDSCAQASGDYF